MTDAPAKRMPPAEIKENDLFHIIGHWCELQSKENALVWQSVMDLHKYVDRFYAQFRKKKNPYNTADYKEVLKELEKMGWLRLMTRSDDVGREHIDQLQSLPT